VEVTNEACEMNVNAIWLRVDVTYDSCYSHVNESGCATRLRPV
jgi:hypothetical protein